MIISFTKIIKMLKTIQSIKLAGFFDVTFIYHIKQIRNHLW